MQEDQVVSALMKEELRLSPGELYNTTFHKVLFGGYDREEVDYFLEEVSAVIETLSKENEGLKAREKALAGEIDSYRQIETTLRNALASSQRFGEDVVESAKREAAALVAEGALEKHKAALAAAKLTDGLREEIQALKESRNRLRIDLEAIIDTHAALLESIPHAEELLTDPRDQLSSPLSNEREEAVEPAAKENG